MNSIKLILYTVVLTVSCDAFGMMYQLNNCDMTEEEAQNTINTLQNIENSPRKDIANNKHHFLQFSKKEIKEKDQAIKLILNFVPGKDQEKYLTDITNICFNKKLNKSEPLPRQMSIGQFYRNELLPRRRST